VIETLQEHEDSSLRGVLFRWQGMNIYLALTLERDGSKFLSVKPDVAILAVHITAKTTVTWTISSEATPKKDATVSTISNGSAPDVTGPNTTGNQG
jgi:hypothetical protein